MVQWLKVFFSVLAVILLCDFIWLGNIANRFYVAQMGDLGRIVEGKFAIHYGGAAMVYLLLVVAILCFALPRAGANASLAHAFLWGALLGLCIYGIYDFTNLATLKQWPFALIVADVAWGTFLCGLANLVACFVNRQQSF